MNRAQATAMTVMLVLAVIASSLTSEDLSEEPVDEARPRAAGGGGDERVRRAAESSGDVSSDAPCAGHHEPFPGVSCERPELGLTDVARQLLVGSLAGQICFGPELHHIFVRMIADPGPAYVPAGARGR